ncbi:hypothetical protein KJ830_04810 [bacterium]|nr:hypothetical protein [bacterium]MBU4510353.1 hypothetical protein [bacterium]
MDCWEEERHRSLHIFRKKLNYYNNYTPKQNRHGKSHNNISVSWCPYCYSPRVEKKGIRNGKQRCYCKNCGKNWTFEIPLDNNQKGTKNESDGFYRETSLREIWEYLKLQETFHTPITFYYRNDVKPRKIYDYYLDKNYINVKTEKGYHIKFLVNKIRKI